MSGSADHIVLAHGGGGQLTDELLARSILPRLNGSASSATGALLDSAVLGGRDGERPALTIDSYVVSPWRFPGGDIGRVAVCGTVNDLAVCGARPAALALGLILAEGFPQADLEAVVASIGAAASEAGVTVVTGDTKVVGAGQADGIYITTAGVGWVPADRALHPSRVQPGDRLLVSGPIAEHGLAVMLSREMPEMHCALQSDAAPIHGLVEALLAAVGERAVFLRDPTRSGVAGVAVDLARDTGLRVVLDEAAIPVRPAARHAADMLGLDPLEVANEGKLVAVVRPDAVDAALNALRLEPLGRDAAVIGAVEPADADDPVACEVRTRIGGRRVLSKPYGEQLPRIC